jgi:hypothetical protein
MNAVLKKMHFKGQAPVLLLDAPPEFAPLAKGFGPGVLSAAKGKAAFILAFCKDQAQAKKAAAAAKRCLTEEGLFWLAYPKGTSKKYKSPDLNRDSGHALLQGLGFDGVSLVAIDSDWSSMRFKRLGGA